MIRYATLALASLVLASGAALADWNPTPGGGSSTVITSVGRGQCVYERQIATGQGALIQTPAAAVHVELDANVSGTDVGDVQAEVRRCPAGTTVYSANTCAVTAYKDKDGTVQTTIDGDVASGTDAIYGMRSQVFVLNTTTHPAAGRVSEAKLCVDAE
jgi:hypothetical protein